MIRHIAGPLTCCILVFLGAQRCCLASATSSVIENYIADVCSIPKPDRRARAEKSKQWCRNVLKEIDRRLSNEPSNQSLLFDKAHLLQYLGRYAEAMKACDEGLRLGDSPMGFYRKASIAFDQHDYSEAILFCNKANLKLPSNRDVLLLRMAAHSLAGHSDCALEDELRVLELLEARIALQKARLKSGIELSKSGMQQVDYGRDIENVNSIFSVGSAPTLDE